MSENTSVGGPLILASSSPRRQQLLREAGYLFEVVVPPMNEPERMGADVPAAHQAEALSYFKARAVAAVRQTGLILAADTVVECNGRVYGKPADRDDARETLCALVGTTHRVITGVSIVGKPSGCRLIRHDVTRVVMRDLPEERIEQYLATGAWKGKAGAYGIQDRGDAFVERIEGSFTNVVGLPMELVAAMLTECGYTVPVPAAAGSRR